MRNLTTIKKQALLIIVATFFLANSVFGNAVKPVQLQAVSCELYAEFCLPLSAKELADYQLFDNGAAWDGSFAPCGLERIENEKGQALIANGVALRLPVGNHHIVLKGRDTKEFQVEVTCEATRAKNCKDVIDSGRAFDAKNNSIEIEIAPSDMLHYDLSVNGKAYTGTITPAQIKAMDAYNVADLQGETFFIESFEINGTLFQATFDSPLALVRQMNEWDVKGNWTLNNKGILVGGNSSQVYSDMIIGVKSTGERYAYEHFTYNVATASSINVQGNAIVQVKHFATGCSDSISLNETGMPTNGTASK